MAEPVGGRLSAALRATYQEAGVSQADIAEALDIDQPTVSRWARGMRRPPLDALPVIERLCGVPVGTILRRAGYVEDVDLNLEHAIAMASELDDDGRNMLTNMYLVLRNEAARRVQGTAASAAPAH